MACQTQFRQGPDGRTGFDYPAVKMVAETLSITWDEKLLNKIRILESALLNHPASSQEETSDGE